MNSDTPLDHVVFQLTPTRASCEVLAVAGEETEKVAAGLIEPFLLHVEAANEQFERGDDAIKLETTAADASTWFTKDTLERFVKLVSDPEVLESVCSIHVELLQLEESSRCMRDGTSGSTTTSVSTGGDMEADNAEFNLEVHRAALYKKQSAASSRATAAGFSVETMPSLIRFCTVFGVTRLLDICDRYVKFCMKKRETEVWLGEMGARGEEKHNRDTMEKQEPSSLQNCTGDVVSPLTSVASACEGDATNESPQDDGDRRLSVQEKIVLFESKKEDAEKRRLSAADAGKTDVHKPVLRRWSLAVEKITGASHQGEGSQGSSENIAEVDEEELCDESQQTDAVGLPELNVGNRNGNQEEHKSDDQRSVLSEGQSLKDTEGRLYEQYREKRDAKLKEESVSLKEERQARLKAMQESLERRRAEVAKALKSKKFDPLAEARQRADKLRAFKAELKKLKEEEERKRLEEIRTQRLQKKLTAPASPRSGGSTPKQQTVRGKTMMKVPLPTFQRVSSVGTNGKQSATNNRMRKSCDALDHPVLPPAELKQGNGKPRVSMQADVTVKGMSLSKEGGSNRLRSTVRKSAPALVERRGGRVRGSGEADGLKSIGLNEIAEMEDIKEVVTVVSSLEGMVIRAPVTDENEKLVGDDSGDELKCEAPVGV